MTLKRICINLPKNLIDELDETVPSSERSELFTELLEDYLDSQSAESKPKMQFNIDQATIDNWYAKARVYGRKAANLFLP